MKKVFLTVAMIAMCIVAAGQTAQTTKVSEQTCKVVKVDDKTFKVVSTKTKSSIDNYKPTGFFYQTRTGEKKEIYLHTVTRGDNKGKTFCYVHGKAEGTWYKIAIKPEDLK